MGIAYLAFSLMETTKSTTKYVKMEILKILNLIKKTKKYGIKVRVNTAVLRENKDDLESLLNKTVKLGVDKHVLFYFTPLGSGCTHVKLLVKTRGMD